MRYKDMKYKEKENTKQLSETNDLFFSRVFVLCFSLLWKYWPKSDGKYALFLNGVFRVTFYLLHVNINSSSCRLLGMLPLYTQCLECRNTQILSYIVCVLTNLIMSAWSRFYKWHAS